MPMTMDEPVAPSMRRTVHSAPSLAMDLSWVISVAVRPQWRPKLPAVFEHLAEGAGRAGPHVLVRL